MGIRRKNENVGQEVIGDQFQGLKTDCPQAEPFQEMFCFVLLYFGLNGVNKEGGGEVGEKKNLKASRSPAWSLPFWPYHFLSSHA